MLDLASSREPDLIRTSSGLDRPALRAPIQPLVETIVVLRIGSFRPTSAAKQSALGDDFLQIAYSLE
jgi:hypothetical protein